MEQNITKGAIVSSNDTKAQPELAIYFDIVSEDTISLQSQITDNYLENNEPVADHIANSPLTISLRGVAGELVYEPASAEGVIDYLEEKFNLSQKLQKFSILRAILPPVDNATYLARNMALYVGASINRYNEILKRYSSEYERQARLKNIYQELSSIWKSRQSLIVRTPYETFDNMYIQSLVLRQREQLFITDIEISLKQIYFVDTQTTKADKKVVEQYAAYQRAEVENHGNIQGSQTGNSQAYDLWAAGREYKNK